MLQPIATFVYCNRQAAAGRRRQAKVGNFHAPAGVCATELGTVDNGILSVCSDANVNFAPLCNISFTPDNVLRAIEKLKNLSLIHI